jgi:streptogramin lyase
MRVRALVACLTSAVLLAGPLVTAAAAAPRYVPPPPPGGTLADLGSPMSSLTVVEGAFGTLPDGTFAAYAAPMGENTELNVSSTSFPSPAPVSLGRYAMKGASGASIVTVSPADGSVYIATFYEGRLFRWDPATKQMTDLGQPVAGETYLYGLSAGPDGTIYGGTYPHAHAFSYKPGAGFTDLGVASPDDTSMYVKSTAYDPDRNALYVGLQTNPRIRRLDLATRTWTDIALPVPPTVQSIIDLDYAGGRLIANAGGFLRVVDTATNTEVPVTNGKTGAVTTTYSLAARGVSDPRQGGVFFSTVDNGKVVLARYDLATDTVTATSVESRRGALIGYGWRVEDGHDVLYAFAGNYSGGGFRYDLTTGASGSMQFAVSPSPSPLQHVLPSADGAKVYIDAFLNGNATVYDVATRAYTPIARLGQVEGWTLLNGRIYAGTYPNGTLLEYDPATNAVRNFARLQDTDQQIRPIEAKAHAGKVYFGTAPDYGQRGGAVAVLDPASGGVEVTRNVVPEHTVASIAFAADRVFLGSSTEGGTGTTPAPGSGRLVQWDATTRQVVKEVVPVAGAGSVNALVTGRNGDLYGLADGTLFQLDPATMTVRRTLKVGSGTAASDGTLYFHPNGYLYASAGWSTYVIDPLAFTSTKVADSTLRLEPSPDRTLWTLLRPAGFTNFLNTGRYTPAATACPNPDTRDHVTLFGIVTPVRNRFVVTGCTIQDLIPVRPAANKSYAGTLGPWLDRLEQDGTITAAERDQLWQAGKAGR